MRNGYLKQATDSGYFSISFRSRSVIIYGSFVCFLSRVVAAAGRSYAVCSDYRPERDYPNPSPIELSLMNMCLFQQVYRWYQELMVCTIIRLT